MNCASVTLSDRKKSARRAKSAQGNRNAPRRICQIRMADPSHEEDPRWKQKALERFHFDAMDSLEQSVASTETAESFEGNGETELNPEMCLSVLNLNLSFSSENNPNPTSRQYFKYKNYPKNCNHHRMFVKQSMSDNEFDYSISDTQSSIHMECRLNDFMQDDILTENADQSAPFFSDIFTYNVDDKSNDHEENIASSQNLKPDIIQGESEAGDTTSELADTIMMNTTTDMDKDIEIEYINNNVSNYDVKYKRTGKRRSLTISRTQSPETVQVIRVDVMCNYPDDISEEADSLEEKPLHFKNKLTTKNCQKSDSYTQKSKVDSNTTGRKPRLYNRIVLASTTTKRDTFCDEDFSLLCKSFKFCDRHDRMSVWKSKN